jgi:high-affinity iron transporter
MLTREDSFSAYYSFLNSALIILREGLEAALILAAIVAMLKVTGTTEAVRSIHLGWVLALVAGGLTWLATETILTFSGGHRESMEGFIAVFAAVALFYVGYWLIRAPRPNGGKRSFKTKSKMFFPARKFSVL